MEKDTYIDQGLRVSSTDVSEIDLISSIFAKCSTSQTVTIFKTEANPTTEKVSARLMCMWGFALRKPYLTSVCLNVL